MEPSVPDANRRSILAARTLAVALGAANAWSSRHLINPGGVSHLDMADAILRGDFGGAVNGYFSPLYSVVVAPAVYLTRSQPHLEAAAVHATNFAIYLFALFAFERFLAAVMERAKRDGTSLPGWAWIAFGYASFMWTALFNNSLTQLTGDLLVAAVAYVAGAILVRMDEKPAGIRDGAVLGLMLGLGFLAKTAMLPLSLLFLVAALTARSEWRRNVRPVAAAAIVLLCVSLPFIVALSVQKGRITTGDIGKLVYAWFVLDVPRYAHWQGDNPPGYGVPLHPERKIHASPDVFEYRTPVGGTLPLFYDPSYWTEGLEVPIRPVAIAQAVLEAARVYWRMAVDASAELLALCVLLWVGGRASARRLQAAWRPLLPVLAVFPMFALVHTEPRFVGGFVTMALLLVLSCLRLPEEGTARRLGLALLLGAAIVIAMRTVAATGSALERGAASSHRYLRIASGLEAAGVKRGEDLAFVGAPFDAYWARLAGVRIVADVADYDVGALWGATPEARETVFAKLRDIGVRHVVAFAVPTGAAATGWQPIGTTGAFLLSLKR